jgi:hypothetical protein
MITTFKANNPLLKSILSIGIALVWLVNGLYCKVLNFVPRHQIIVSRILGEDYSSILTKTIGVSEILMAIWILSRIKARFCALSQIAIVALMNIIEFIVVPDLLLFGRLNIVFATCFVAIVYLNEFIISSVCSKKSIQMKP